MNDKMSKREKVYVVSPANKVSGGPEALHQLVYYLRLQGTDAMISYIGKSRDSVSIPAEYTMYADDFILFREIPDESNARVVLPEIYLKLTQKFTTATVNIWWLSVNNAGAGSIYRFSNPLEYFYLQILRQFKATSTYCMIRNARGKAKFYGNRFLNLVGSFYAHSFLEDLGISNIHPMIEPIGKTFLEEIGDVSFSSSGRSDTILYNPIKDFKGVIPKLIKLNPDLTFVALEGFSHPEMIELFKTSKLYVDFGLFPGPERIPKEAVMCGCLVYTGRYGASDFYGDVAIPDKYKIKRTGNVAKISNTLRQMLNTYDDIVSDFDEYRAAISQLETNFKNTLVKEFS